MENPSIILDCIWVFASHNKFGSIHNQFPGQVHNTNVLYWVLGEGTSNVESEPKVHMNNMLSFCLVKIAMSLLHGVYLADQRRTERPVRFGS